MFGNKKTTRQDNRPARRRQDDASSGARSPASEVSDRYAFRRNRTITGSSSARIASSTELNADLRSPRAHAHHLTTLRRRLLVYFLAVMSVSFVLYLLVSQLTASMSLSVTGAELLPKEDRIAYTATLDEYYAARPIERLRFLLNQDELLSHMQATHPELKHIRVESGDQLGDASVVLEARHAIARWSIDGNNRYVDEEGVVFARNYFKRPTLQIIDNSGIHASSTQAVASNRFLGFVGRVIASSKKQGLEITKVTIPTLTTRQVAVNLKGRHPYYKFSIDRSVGQQVEDMARIDGFMRKQGIAATYVDVRIEGKAFYR